MNISRYLSIKISFLTVLFLAGCNFESNNSPNKEIYLSCEFTRHLNGNVDATDAWSMYPRDKYISLFLDLEKKLFITDGTKSYGYGDLNLYSTFDVDKTKIKYKYKTEFAHSKWIIDRVTLEAWHYSDTSPDIDNSHLQWEYQCKSVDPI